MGKRKHENNLPGEDQPPGEDGAPEDEPTLEPSPPLKKTDMKSSPELLANIPIEVQPSIAVEPELPPTRRPSPPPPPPPEGPASVTIHLHRSYDSLRGVFVKVLNCFLPHQWSKSEKLARHRLGYLRWQIIGGKIYKTKTVSSPLRELLLERMQDDTAMSPKLRARLKWITSLSKWKSDSSDGNCTDGSFNSAESEVEGNDDLYACINGLADMIVSIASGLFGGNGRRGLTLEELPALRTFVVYLMRTFEKETTGNNRYAGYQQLVKILLGSEVCDGTVLEDKVAEYVSGGVPSCCKLLIQVMFTGDSQLVDQLTKAAAEEYDFLASLPDGRAYDEVCDAVRSIYNVERGGEYPDLVWAKNYFFIDLPKAVSEGTLESLYESNPLVPRAASFVPIDTDVAQTDATTVGASISSGARRASIPSTIQKQASKDDPTASPPPLPSLDEEGTFALIKALSMPNKLAGAWTKQALERYPDCEGIKGLAHLQALTAGTTLSSTFDGMLLSAGLVGATSTGGATNDDGTILSCPSPATVFTCENMCKNPVVKKYVLCTSKKDRENEEPFLKSLSTKSILGRPETPEERAGAGGCMSIDNFEIISLIAHGATTYVFGAVHLPSGCRVALKFSTVKSDEFMKFCRGFCTQANMGNHPSVASVFGYFLLGQEDHDKALSKNPLKEVCVVVAEELGFGTLKDLEKKFPKEKPLHNATMDFKRKRWPKIVEGRLDVALPPLIQVFEAVLALHASNAIHRDLKPENVIELENGYKVTDFGTAKPLRDPKGGRGTALSGTFGYIPREALSAQQSYGFYSDSYALGVILYEIIVRSHPRKHFSDLVGCNNWLEPRKVEAAKWVFEYNQYEHPSNKAGKTTYREHGSEIIGPMLLELVVGLTLRKYEKDEGEEDGHDSTRWSIKRALDHLKKIAKLHQDSKSFRQ